MNAYLYELPLCQAFALANAALEMDPWSNARRSSEGYIGEEVRRRKGGDDGRPA